MLTAVEVQKTKLGSELEELGKRHGHEFRFIRLGGTIVEPLYMQDSGRDYYIVPRHMDDSFVPGEADRAAGLVIANAEIGNYKVIGQLIVHDLEELEARYPDKKGIEEPEVEPEKEIEVIEIDLDNEYAIWERRIKKIGETIWLGILAVAGIFMTIVTAAAAMLPLLILDPALILIIEQENGTQFWFEVANWPKV